MTNLEFYKDEIYEMQRDLFENKDICVSRGVGIAICDVYEKYKGVHAFMPMVLDWLLEEHKEPIELTEFEHDVLKAFTRLHTYVEGDRIEDFRTLQELTRDGWFRGVENLSIKEILDNCEVVER